MKTQVAIVHEPRDRNQSKLDGSSTTKMSHAWPVQLGKNGGFVVPAKPAVITEAAEPGLGFQPLVLPTRHTVVLLKKKEGLTKNLDRLRSVVRVRAYWKMNVLGARANRNFRG